MKPKLIVNALLEGNDWARQLIGEASVHRPHRSLIWVASFTGADGQEWRSTGTTDQALALTRAREFEAAARANRPNPEQLAPKQRLIIRRSPGVSGGGLTQREVSLLLGLSERAVRGIEKRALRKLARHPGLRELWREFLAGELTEQAHRLSALEINALLGLTRSRAERSALQKALELVQTRTGPESKTPPAP